MNSEDLKRRVAITELIGWVLFWAMMLAVEVQDYQRNGGKYYWQPVLWELSSAVVISVLLYALNPVLNDQTLMRTPRRWFARVLLWHPLVCVVFVIAVFAIRHLVYAAMGHQYLHEPWDKVFLYETIKLSLFLSLFYVIFFGIQSYMLLVDEREKATQALAQLQKAQLKRLTQQMQPHFLFNALNTISSLMYSDLKAADTAISRLAELLRSSLDLNQADTASLQKEVEMLQAYAELMSLRFVDRVVIRWQLDSASLSCLVPVLALQTLLENTFKHTVEKNSRLTTVDIQSRIEHEMLELIVQDDIGVLKSNEGGVGLNNLRQRLASIYCERAQLTIEVRAGGGVRTTLLIPMQHANK
ncbi:histidine kinase [Undibacterium sp. LX40W]|uniref:Histidine kinase n=1 Tax=Undibacterium nitidum TaxID=2762298 RepID=A0A923HNJ0_9BURK|nr:MULTISPECIES: histidine kinase [Undibacterium]MBC3882835.1 histidine kinase [Undibacterium nitidum]MBC3892982.1 histidine kinase [Undibacterium sp. LX40W]